MTKDKTEAGGDTKRRTAATSVAAVAAERQPGKHELEIQEYVEDTMNELLGWYGYERLSGLRHGFDLVARHGTNNSTSTSSLGNVAPIDDVRTVAAASAATPCDVVKKHDRLTDSCASPASGCSSTSSAGKGLDYSTHHQETEFVDVERRDSVERDNEELPVADNKNLLDDADQADSAGDRARSRTSSGTRGGGMTTARQQQQRRCDWCQRLGPCSTVIDAPPADCCSTPVGGQQGDVGSDRNAGGVGNGGLLAFCDEVCLGRYKMNIFCIETQQHLQQIGVQKSSSSDAPAAASSPQSACTSDGPAAQSDSSTFLVTPELWMTSPSNDVVTRRRNAANDDVDSRQRATKRPRFQAPSSSADGNARGLDIQDDHSRSSDSTSCSWSRDAAGGGNDVTNRQQTGSSRRSTSSVVSRSSTTTPTTVSGTGNSLTGAIRATNCKPASTSGRHEASTRHWGRSPAVDVAPVKHQNTKQSETKQPDERSSASGTTGEQQQQPPPPLLAPWLFGHFGQQQQPAMLGVPVSTATSGDAFLAPPSQATSWLPMWPPGCLPPSFGTAPAAHQSLWGFPAIPTAAGGRQQLNGLPNLPPYLPLHHFLPPMMMPNAYSGAPAPASGLGTTPAPRLQAPTPTTVPFPPKSLQPSLFPAPSSSALPPNMLLVPYPMPLPLPLPVPVPIPVPFDPQILSKSGTSAECSSDGSRLDASLASGSGTSANVEKMSPRSLPTQLLGDVTWSKFTRKGSRLSSDGAARRSLTPPSEDFSAAHQSIPSPLPTQTTALDFSTTSRSNASSSAWRSQSASADDRSAVNSNTVAGDLSTKVKAEPVETRTNSSASTSNQSDQAAASVIGGGAMTSATATGIGLPPPPLPYSARRNLILDAPQPPQQTLSQRDVDRDVSDRRRNSGFGDVTTNRKLTCKRRAHGNSSSALGNTGCAC